MRDLVLFFFLFFFLACSPKGKEDGPSFPYRGIGKVELLGHRGSGGIKGGVHPPNSMKAVRYGLRELDGVEIDLQLGKDSTIWLFHDHRMKTCEGEPVNISELGDSSIEQIGQCSYEKDLIPFREMLAALEKRPPSGQKVLSLDIKALRNPVAIQRFGGKSALAHFIADRLKCVEGRPAGLRYYLEIPYKEQLGAFEGLGDELFYLVGADDGEDVLRMVRERDLPLSAPLSFVEGHLKPATKKGREVKKLQLWPVKTGNELRRALRYSPDAVQSDNVSMLVAAEQMAETGPRYEQWKTLPVHKLEGRYSRILKKGLKAENNGSFLDLSFSSPRGFESEELLFVASINGKDDEDRYWRKESVKNGKQRILLYLPARKEGCLLKLYFWNRGDLESSFKALRIGIWKARSRPASEARHSAGGT